MSSLNVLALDPNLRYCHEARPEEFSSVKMEITAKGERSHIINMITSVYQTMLDWIRTGGPVLVTLASTASSLSD